MKFETKTSFYELTKNGDEFSLTKTALKDGEVSTVGIGRTFKANKKEVYIVWDCLCVGDMHTSTIVNANEVEKFIES